MKAKHISINQQQQQRTLTYSGIIFLLLVWCLLTYGKFINPLYLPSPSQVIAECSRLFQRGILLRFTIDSITRVAIGWASACLLAVPIGIAIGISRRANALFKPAIVFARYLPVVALLPLTILYFGFGEVQKYFIIFLGSFFQLVLMVADTISTIPRNYYRTGIMLGANQQQIVRRILLPAATPGILDSMRITVGWAWTYMVIAEMVASHSGLGYMILSAQQFLATDRIFGGLLIIGFLAVVTDFLFRSLIRWLTPWNDR